MRGRTTIAGNSIFAEFFDSFDNMSEYESACLVREHILKLRAFTCGELEQNESGVYYVELLDKDNQTTLKEMFDIMSKANIINFTTVGLNNLIDNIKNNLKSINN